MSTEENKRLVRRFVDEVINEGRHEVVSELFAPDFVEHSLPAGRKANLAGLKQTFAMLRKAFPDIRQEIHTMVAEDDMVAFCGTHECTNLGPFMGRPATGREVRYAEFHMVRIDGGKYVEHWSEVDRLGLFQQLGYIPRWEQQKSADPDHVGVPPKRSSVEGEAPASAEEYRSIIKTFFAEVWSRGNMDAVDELISPDVVAFDPLGLVGARHSEGTEGVKRLVKQLRRGFPDMNTVPEQIVVENDWAITRWVGTGTHDGEFMGRPPSGREVRVTGTTVTRTLDGRFVEAGDSWDTLGMMQQLGWVDTEVR